MMKNLVFSIGFALCFLSGFGQSTATADQTLSIETGHDFGSIPQGKPATYAFVLTNTGSQPMELEHVSASCGCTTPEWTKGTIPPGGKSIITVGYNAAAEGKFEKTITIAYNKGQVRTVFIKGQVEKAQPSAAYNASIQLLKQSNQSQNR
ncbi:MAG TPA: DUF1573 domain-containing protein [Flavihumibacter sp.]|nr:DUF1573 domain-containing protein [Bacteroidota bacterium]HOA38584.1 DUF1573 domain-containing protein [Flavihumibacter sp.]HQD11008.1 DUF1573 domain-containing protein [Flavihumibacter sp.]